MSQKTVVIVEDEFDTAEMLGEMMRLIGFQVFKSTSGKRAIDLIAEKKPNAVLLDQMMPDLTGLEVLGVIRKDPHLCHIPVIIVSAKCLPSDLRRGLEAGAACYLTKPVAFIDLKQAVEQAVDTQSPFVGQRNSGSLFH
jgi:two-component system alkaline phosphatase synthesis response regulator PhoP